MASSVEGQVRIAAPVERVRTVIDDVDAYAEWARGIRTSTVEAHDEQGRAARARFVVDTPIGPVGYVLAYEHTDRAVRWQLVEGELLETLDGSYRVRADGDGSVVEGALEVGVSLPVPASLVRKMSDEILTKGLDDLRSRCEGTD
jgi:hypothetical protein